MSNYSGGPHSRYSNAAIALHWTIAILVIAQVVFVILFHNLLDSSDPAEKAAGATFAMLHKSTGLLILAVTLGRLGLRLSEGFIPLPGHMRTWEVILARGNHILFYMLLLALPLAGWAFAVTAERPLMWYGLFEVPVIPLAKVARGGLHEAHEILALLTIALVVLHICGALKHYFLDRDDVVARMLPILRRTS